MASEIASALLHWIDLDGQLQFAGRALRPPSPARAEWADIFAELSKAQWLKPEIRVRAQHLKAKGTGMRF